MNNGDRETVRVRKKERGNRFLAWAALFAHQITATYNFPSPAPTPVWSCYVNTADQESIRALNLPIVASNFTRCSIIDLWGRPFSTFLCAIIAPPIGRLKNYLEFNLDKEKRMDLDPWLDTCTSIEFSRILSYTFRKYRRQLLISI